MVIYQSFARTRVLVVTSTTSMISCLGTVLHGLTFWYLCTFILASKQILLLLLLLLLFSLMKMLLGH